MATPVERLAEQLYEVEAVRAIRVDGTRLPPRVMVDLSTDSIPDAMHDLIDHHSGDLVDAHVRPGQHLTVTVAVPERWKDGGPRTVRAIGSSTGLTLPPEALEASGITEDTEVDVHARPGELHIRDHQNGPRLP